MLWIAIALLAYIYVGYPILAIAFARIRPRHVDKRAVSASVTTIITAYNEEKHIEQKIRNVLALDYPKHQIDIIVASDASSDATDGIVLGFNAPNVRLLRVEGRQGKTACQNAAAAIATGDILVFTDATTSIEAHALQAMSSNFHDPSVGCVAGRLTYVAKQDDATGHGGTSYWNYEIMLRMAESMLGSLIGVSGCLYAIRRSAYRAIAPGLISDFVVAMMVRDQDLRTVLEPDAVCYEHTLDHPDRELSMRVRVGMRSLSALAAQKRFLDPFRFGAFAWQLWSHKLLRYLSPVFWMAALLANAVLASQGRYLWLLAMQLALLLSGLLGFTPLRLFTNSRLLAQPYYFLLTNLASAVSLYRFLRGERIVTWTPLR
ncbi:glycosyltransferase family 2 protein [Lysobacter fragariae]